MSKRHEIIIVSNQRTIYQEIKDETESLDVDIRYIEELNFTKSSNIKSDAVIFVGSEKVSKPVIEYCYKNKINLIDYSSPVPEAKMLASVYSLLAEFKPEYFAVNLMMSPSYYGEEGVSELTSQTIAMFNQGLIESSVFPKRMAFNLLPALGRVMEDGKTVVESGIENLLGKILDNKDLCINVNTMVVPVVTGVFASISMKLSENINLAKLIKKIENSEDFICYSEANDFPTVLDLDKDRIQIARIKDCGKGYVSMFVLADNIKTLRIRPLVEQIKSM